MKEMQPDEFTAGESDASGGATGIFGVIKSPAADGPELKAAEEEPVVAASSSQESQTATIKMREVVFKATDHATFEDTDALRRILDSSPAATIVPVAPASEASGAGGFTQLLRAMSPQPPTAVGIAPVPVATSSIPPDVSEEASKASPGVHPEPVAGLGAGESFTRMFGVTGVPATSAAPAAEAIPSQNVGFTQLFQSFKAQPPVSSAQAPPAIAASQTPPVVASGLSDMPVQRVAPVAPKEDQAQSATDAVFSQPVNMPELAREILQETGVGSTPWTNSPVIGGSVSAPETRSQPVGSFTQLFQTLAKPSGPVLSEPVKPPAAPSSGDSGTFTQLFSSLGSRPPAKMTQADSFPPLSPSSQPSHGGFGGGEGFGASPPVEAYLPANYREPAYREPRPSEPVFSTPPTPASNPAAEGGGEMTRLLRRLDSASSGQATPPPLKTEPLPVANPVPETSRSMGAAEGATVAFRIPETSAANFHPAPTEPAPNTGAGGMTRILNASALRENLRRGVGNEAPAASAPATAPAMGGGGSFAAMSSFPALPAMPGPPMQMPPAQSQPTAAPHFQMPPTPQMQVPPVPPIQVPKLDGAAQAGSGKSWVPILLIMIIVLLVGILLAVVLLMKK